MAAERRRLRRGQTPFAAPDVGVTDVADPPLDDAEHPWSQVRQLDVRVLSQEVADAPRRLRRRAPERIRDLGPRHQVGRTDVHPFGAGRRVVAQVQAHAQERRAEAHRDVEGRTRPGVDVVERDRGWFQTEGEYERPVEHAHRDRVIRRERSVALPAEPSVFDGDGGVAVPAARRVEVGEHDRRVGRLAGRERSHDRAREVLPGLDRVWTERVRAVSVGGEVTHPVVGRGDEPDTFPRPPIRRREIREADPGHGRRAHGSTGRRGVDDRERRDPRSSLPRGPVPTSDPPLLADGRGRLC